MKAFISLIHVVMFFSLCLQSVSAQQPTYTTITPANTTDIKFADVCFRDPLNAFIVSNTGVLLRSADGGKSWDIQEKLQNRALSGIYFKTLDTAFVVGKSKIFKSNDGGETWTAIQTLPEKDIHGNTYSALDYVTFISKSTGFSYGSGLIWKTSDGGNTWKEVLVEHDVFFGNITSIHFTDVLHGRAFSLNKNYETTDGGETWVRVVTESFLGESYFFDAQHGLISESEKGAILETFDGGVTWTEVYQINEFDILSEFHFSEDGKNGKMMNYGSVFLHSSDSGKTWSRVDYSNSVTTLSYTYGMDFGDENTGVIVGTKGVILHTEDGGLTWTGQNWGFPNGFKRIDFTDSLHGHVCCNDGKILHTKDGGTSWTLSELGQGFTTEDVSFPTIDTGYVTAGDHLYYSHNGGESWTQTVTNKQLEARHFMCFTSVDTGYVGFNFWGELYRTFDGGVTVTRFDSFDMHIEEHDKLLAGSFPDSQHGFIFGPKGSFAYTTNAGNNWTRKDMQITPGKSVLNCHFYDSKTGIAMTDKLYRTEDGGLSWTVTFPYPTAKYYPITESAGYLKYFSTTDSVYYTADQGLTFELQHKGSVIWDEIDFVNPYLAYCTNSDGIFRVDFPRPVPEPADTQRVAVPAGWSLFSTYLHLRDSSIANVFAGTNISIIKTMDKQWQMIYPAYMNTLPHIHAGEGYLIYSENPETLVLLGKPMTATVPHLAQGWNLYGCQSATEEDIDILFQGVSAVKNEDGFWQPTGVSSISKIKPGKGYFIFKE